MMKNTLNIGLQLRYLRTSHTQRVEISQGVRTHLTHLVWVRPWATVTLASRSIFFGACQFACSVLTLWHLEALLNINKLET